MTDKRTAQAYKEEAKSVLLLGITLLFGLTLSGEIGEYTREGLRLAVSTVIPTSLPFMIVSDFYVCYGKPENIRALRRVFSGVFGINGCGLAPFICGNIGGFPIGVKMCSELYSEGLISKGEAERLMPLSNNPSCAFIVGGVGMGILGNARVGILLLISVYCATLLCGLITRAKTVEPLISGYNANNSYDFINSVKKSGQSCVAIISFISIFSAINGIVKSHVKYMPLIYLISAFSEVTNAVKLYAGSSDLGPLIPLILIAFALGFGGVCVGLQSAVFSSSVGLKMKKYYLIKLLEGILSASIFSILYTI